ncbi:hypothetical protein OS493_039057 [Desmophyllum pertusum]|uniref:Uncharacterized protein n=1 Tax=Desmophyllum pertusum TaxID=174260 RepID=A0A9W9ZUU3_9CNID|nr:hypothetical protein OS493_039057 [Desmophyllum pertusum]
MSKRMGEENGEQAVSKKSSPQLGDPLNMTEWIEDNKSFFLPPVCNKMMYGEGQLKVMFVGGPMSEKIIILTKARRIQHSPQRKEDTVGLVIERERLPKESDGLRYFCEDGVTPVWEKWFHCDDLGTQLGPLIKEYFASEEYKTGTPNPDKIAKDPPVKVDLKTGVNEPFSLKEWIVENKSDIECGTKELFGQGEFKINIHGEGEQSGEWHGETWLCQIEGDASVTVNGETKDLTKDDVILIPSGSKYTVKRSKGSIGLSVIMDPMANK